MRGPRGDDERLLDIQEALEAIHRYPIATFQKFMDHELVRFFAAKHIEIVGEAVCKISANLKAEYPDVPWHSIEKTRHILVHDYFEIDWKTIWMILETRIEPLRSQINAIISKRGIHDSDEV